MPCHRNAMGSNRQTVPKVCGKKGCREREGERDKGSVKWRCSAVCRPLISSLQLPQTPLDFCLSHHRSSTLPFRTPFRRHAGEPRLSWLSIVFLLSCCFTLGLVLPVRDSIPAFLSLWCLIRACSWSWVSVTALSPPLRTHTHFCPLDRIHWPQRPTVHCRA